MSGELATAPTTAIDGVAGVRAVPWGHLPPRAVQVVFRHGAALPKSSGTTVQPPVLTSAPPKPTLVDGDCEPRQSDGASRVAIGWQRLSNEQNARILRATPACLQPQIALAQGASKGAKLFEPGSNHCRGPAGTRFEPNALGLAPIARL